MLSAEPLTESCARPLADRHHVCIGVSPFNSYFSVPRITALARWASTTFDAYAFFVPDRAAAHTLEAVGYTPARAAYKARRQGRYVLNKIARALAEIGVTDPAPHVLDSAALARVPAYGALLTRVHAAFASGAEFREQCLQASRWVLDKRLPDGVVATRDQLSVAVRYFLAEMPMFLDSAAIARVPGSVFAYHQRVPFLEALYREELALVPHPRQGFAVLSGLEALAGEEVTA